LKKLLKFQKSKTEFHSIHGDEDEEFISELRKFKSKIKIIKVIRIGNQTQMNYKKPSTINHQPSTILLFDTDSKAFGGTGKTFDWNILNDIEIPIPYFLSGGISLENIHQLSTINHQPLLLTSIQNLKLNPELKI
jgi:phosphoribosylanthranilate isomerase